MVCVTHTVCLTHLRERSGGLFKPCTKPCKNGLTSFLSCLNFICLPWKSCSYSNLMAAWGCCLPSGRDTHLGSGSSYMGIAYWTGRYVHYSPEGHVFPWRNGDRSRIHWPLVWYIHWYHLPPMPLEDSDRFVSFGCINFFYVFHCISKVRALLLSFFASL